MPRKRKERDECCDAEAGATGSGRSHGRPVDERKAASCLDITAIGRCGLRGRPTPLNSSAATIENIYFEKQQSKAQHCMLHAVNNLFGAPVLSYDMLDLQRKDMDEKHWKPYWEGLLEDFQAKNKSKKAIDAFKKTLSNGNDNGNWTVNVLADFILKYTDVKLVRISREAGTKSGHIHRSTLLRALKKYNCVLVLCEWYQYKVNQAHWIAIRGNVVLDSMKSKPCLLENYDEECGPLLQCYATRMYAFL